MVKPNLLLLRKTICHEELRKDTTAVKTEKSKNDCSSNKNVVYRGE